MIRLVADRVGIDNFNQVGVKYVWNWPTWNRIVYHVVRATASHHTFHRRDCWFSTYYALTNSARPTIHIGAGTFRLCRDTSAKKESLRLMFTRSKNAAPFKGAVARLLTALLYGPPPLVDPTLGLYSDPTQCSHRCHNDPQRCINPYYTIWESDSENKNRNSCVNGHAMYCCHEPKCIYKDSDGRYLPHRNMGYWEPCNCEGTNFHEARITE